MPRDVRLTEEEQRAETAHGAGMGDPMCRLLMLLDGAAGWWNSGPAPKPYTPWWRQWKFRFLVLAALAALLISGSRLL